MGIQFLNLFSFIYLKRRQRSSILLLIPQVHLLDEVGPDENQ